MKAVTTISTGQLSHTWVGSIVLSLAGRDKHRLYMVMAADEENGYVYIADGKLRQIQHPKRKKCKHLKIVRWGSDAYKPEEVSTLTNKRLHALLADICF